ncbi:MAG: valine--tRNA ligase [Chloroflexi bacterium]|nr:valine--tRNA ligase [Chloroflexota bacterium]
MTISRGERMAKAYDPAATEQKWYRFWEAGGYFAPRSGEGREPFTIIMPPPNVTGELHMGHALTNAVEDILIRWRRMQGYAALYLPGADHAGIAGQNVVERHIAREGLTRHDLGREQFIDRVWEWMDVYRPRIQVQLRTLGASCDWSRYRFTMDDEPSRAVRKVFKTLYDEGLIYRGTRMVNWCWRCATVLSDLEVEHDQEQSSLWYARYPIEGEPDRWVTVATTRPETILGDTAIAVHPDDGRYAALIGRQAIVPVLGRRIPIIADAAVDPAFGTGAVKVTPAHDPVDYEIGQRHGLPAPMVMNLDNTMSAGAGPFAGQSVDDARAGMVDWLRAHDQLVKIEPHAHAVGHCERCGTVAQPIISEQWFVRMEPLARPAIAAALDGRVTFVPERFTRIYLNWLENIRDWTISRQLWWGHRIPVWTCQQCGEITVTEAATLAACPRCGGLVEQDQDVLDTWFSSALWPMTTLGWPDDTDDFRTYYPTSVMETGYDIIFFWVARMIFQGLHFTGQAPFHTVYLHGLVRDANGEKMSKSKGNVIDPTTVTAQYGSDALRFTLATGSTPGNDMKLSLERVEHSRNFANKLWNATRFVLSQVDTDRLPRTADGTVALPDAAALALADRWVLSRLAAVTADATRLLEECQLGEAGRQMYEFVWSEYCDWYIEASKPRLQAGGPAAAATGQVLCYVLERSLRLLHPYLPFVTEELWQELPHAGPALIVADWPAAGARDEVAEHDFGRVIETVRAVRNARSEQRVEPGRWIEALIVAGDAVPLFEQERAVLSTLARIDAGRLTVTADAPAPGQALALVVDDATIYLPLAGLVDLAVERQRLEKELADAERDAAGARRMLDDAGFLAKARADVVQRQRDRLAEVEERQARLRQRLAEVSGTA